MRVRRAQVMAGVLMAALLSPFGLVGAAQQEFSSNNRERGRAAVEYKDADIHVVAAYYHSQRNHDSRWLMIETAVSTNDLQTIERKAFALRAPDGREIPLATQREVGKDTTQIERLLQNGSAVRHNVLSYFTQRDQAEGMRLFRLPFGDVVHDSFVTDPHRVSVGTLFFRSPTGAWAEGTYALIVRHSKGAAELPIRLE